LARAQAFHDFAFQVEMNIVSGHSGGLVVRTDSNISGYYIRLSTDGTYLVKRTAADKQGNAVDTPLFAGQSAAIWQGNNQTNVLTVMAMGSELSVYINQQFVTTVTDATYQSGYIGVFADSDAAGAAIQLRNAQVWQR
jgi:hypothetical protein